MRAPEISQPIHEFGAPAAPTVLGRLVVLVVLGFFVVQDFFVIQGAITMLWTRSTWNLSTSCPCIPLRGTPIVMDGGTDALGGHDLAQTLSQCLGIGGGATC